MENKSYALWAGIFTVGLTVALAAAIYWFSRDSSSRVPVEFVSRVSIAGLAPQSTVRYRGVEVGKVTDIALDRKEPGLIVVRAAVEPDTPLTRSTFATLGYQGVTGLAFVQLDDTGQSRERLATSAQQPARLELQPGLLDRVTRQGEAVLKQLEQGVQRFNDLMQPANQQAVVRMLHDVSNASQGLRTASAEFVKLRQQLGPTIDRLPTLANDAHGVMVRADKALRSVEQAASGVETLTGKLSQTGGVLDQAAQGVAEAGFALSRVAGDTLPRINALADEGTRSARALTRAVDGLSDQPQSLIFGKRPIAPGPGEPGFAAPAAQGAQP
jgi:phospholipid/cholesterol/gamma-HCH transport system substrate-binding protein